MESAECGSISTASIHDPSTVSALKKSYPTQMKKISLLFIALFILNQVSLRADQTITGTLTVSGSIIDSGYLVVGSGNTATAWSIAAGQINSATGYTSIAMGYDCVATNFGSISLGAFSNAGGMYAVALGFANQATGTGAVALGYNSYAYGNYSLAAGTTLVNADYSFAVGEYNWGSGTTGHPAVSDPAFEVGNGGSWTTQSDALVVHKDGSAAFQGAVRVGPGGDITMGTFTAGGHP